MFSKLYEVVANQAFMLGLLNVISYLRISHDPLCESLLSENFVHVMSLGATRWQKQCFETGRLANILLENVCFVSSSFFSKN